MRLSIYREGVFDRLVDLPTDGNLRIGRAPDNEIVLDDPDKGVSRYHAEIRCEHGACVVVDLNSPNGVWTGDQRIDRLAIGIGTAITLGPFHLFVEDQSSAGDDSQSTHVNVISDQAREDSYPLTRSSPAGPPNPPFPVSAGRRMRVSRGLVAAALIAILLVLITIVSFRSQMRKTHLADQPHNDAPPPVQSSPPPVQTGPAPADPFQARLDAARAARDAGDLDRAASEVQAALDLQPANDEALQMKNDIEERRHRTAAPAPPPPDQALVDLPPGVPRGPRNRGESPADYKQRMIDYSAAWHIANDALKAGDADAALEALKRVPNDNTYPDKPALMARAHDLRASREQLAKARSSEASGELLQALHAYQPLSNDAEPTIANEAKSKVATLKTAIDAAIEAAFKEARIDSLGDSSEWKQKAQDALQRVLRLTDPGDPRRAEAEKRLHPRGGG